MLENISIGRYYKADSLLHRTDPRVKTILYILYLAAIFIISTPQAIIALTVITLIQLIMGKIKPGILWTTVKPILPLAIFILLLNVLTIGQGNVLFEWKIIKITDNGIYRAVLMAVRLMFLIVSTSILLTLTTTPLKISDALEKLFSPMSPESALPELQCLFSYPSSSLSFLCSSNFQICVFIAVAKVHRVLALEGS